MRWEIPHLHVLGHASSKYLKHSFGAVDQVGVSSPSASVPSSSPTSAKALRSLAISANASTATGKNYDFRRTWVLGATEPRTAASKMISVATVLKALLAVWLHLPTIMKKLTSMSRRAAYPTVQRPNCPRAGTQGYVPGERPRLVSVLRQ
jgi:hypothetical protein